jgi:ABC transporter substrate binding protein (PQQ-dependent alcohol dehydrogenase system)
MSSVSAYTLRRRAKLLASVLTSLAIAWMLIGTSVAEEPAASPAPAASPPSVQTSPSAAPAVAAPGPADAAATPAATPDAGTAAASLQKAKIVYLGKAYPEPLPLSYAERPITDKGIQGARLYIKEANQSGGFVGMGFDLVEAIVPANGDVVAKAKEILKDGDALIVADLEPADLIAVADLPEAKNSVIMNIRSSAEVLRQELCRQNVFHIIPDWAMRADALAQYLIVKKWPRWFVIRGDSPADKDYLAMIQRAAKRYGGKIVEERVYSFPPGARNLDSGYQQVQGQIPMTTQGAAAHDVIWVIDTDDNFGDYLPYRTSEPDLVVGTQGMQALAWDRSYTEYGAMTFQNDLLKRAKRDSTERDYTAWIGVRALTDAAMRSGKTDAQDIKKYLLSDDFNLEGHKGLALTFRSWDHQMRQPVILGGTRTPVSKSPQEGFLHEKNLTDTLGFDEPETKCKLLTEGNAK